MVGLLLEQMSVVEYCPWGAGDHSRHWVLAVNIPETAQTPALWLF